MTPGAKVSADRGPSVDSEAASLVGIFLSKKLGNPSVETIAPGSVGKLCLMHRRLSDGLFDLRRAPSAVERMPEDFPPHVPSGFWNRTQ